uniref:Cadherin domain-containing protein n=1 Tax=Octopus bimaculoides TaxID=37653 RepID=A0A0L8FH51_OCTBM
MFVAICILLSCMHCSLCKDITFHVKEENVPYYFIGDIATETLVTKTLLTDDASLFTFNQLKQKGTQLFNVTKEGKLYTAQTLDAEVLCRYNTECYKTVKIAIHKHKTFTKILKIKVVIEDTNDHQPEFPEEEITLHFREGDGKGMKKAIPNAVDKDVGYQNRLINYKLRNNSVKFVLSVSKRVDGISRLEIVLNEKLDREQKDIYHIQVSATDGGSPPKQCVLEITIIVEDENDNLPLFSNDIYNISIQNTYQIFKPILTPSANDKDSGKNGMISYYFSPMTSDIDKTYFGLNKTTGDISLIDEIDIDEEKIMYTLYIEARDGGNPPLSSIAAVHVNVINEHNKPPNIDVNFISTQNHNTATILEDIKVGSFIAYVMVTDNDVGHNGQVNCHIKDDTFKLQSMGSKEYKIVLKKAVDRETQEHYHFTVSCEDKGLPALKTDKDLSIQVLDVNDKYSQPIEVTSYGDNRPSSNYPTDTLTSRKSSGQCWSERSSRQYEEIPAMSGHYTIRSDMSASNEGQLYQERYVKNPERQLPSPPDVINQ